MPWIEQGSLRDAYSRRGDYYYRDPRRGCYDGSDGLCEGGIGPCSRWGSPWSFR